MNRDSTRPRRVFSRPFSISLGEGELYNNRFRILKTAAFGGMSRIYKAEDTTTGEPVALKVLTLSRTDQLIIQRFEREIKILRTVKHANLVRAIDHGVAPNGDLYLALEWLEGLDLGDVMTTRDISTRESLEIARGILRGLEVVHHAGIIHRDLKPANVFVLENTRPPSGIKLLDFGVAKIINEDLEVNTKRPLTTAGMVVGTPYYMSPEQAQGQDDIDTRADLYSVGSALFELISKERCFKAKSALALLVKIATEPAPEIQSIVPDIEPEINELLKKALQQNPDDRFQTAREMEEAISKILSNNVKARTTQHMGELTDFGTERMETEALESTDAQKSVCQEEVEAVTSRADAFDDTDMALSNVPEATAMIVQDTNGSDEWQKACDVICELTVAAGGEYKRIRQGLIVSYFSHTIGSAASAMEIAAQIVSTEGADIMERALRVSVVATTKEIDEAALIDTACTQLEYAERNELIIDSLVRQQCFKLLTTKERHPGKFIVQSYRDQNFGTSPKRDESKFSSVQSSVRKTQAQELFEKIENHRKKRESRVFAIRAGFGMGRSQFLMELKYLLDKELPRDTILFSQCEEAMVGKPLYALTQALKRSCVIRIGDDQDTRFQKLMRLIPSQFTARQRTQTQESLAYLVQNTDQPTDSRAPSISPFDRPSRSPNQSRQLYNDVLRFLSETSKHKPLILILDDAHWCDRSTIELLEALMRQNSTGVLLVLSIDPKAEKSSHAGKLLQRFAHDHINLQPLGLEEIAELARDQLKFELSEEICTLLHEKSGGNIQYLQEILATLPRTTEEEAIREALDRVSPEIERLIAHHFESLEPGDLEILRVASAFGIRFWDQGISRILRTPIEAAIARLSAQNIIYPVETSRFPRAREYSFQNRYLWEAVQRKSTASQRTQFQSKVVDWLLSQGEHDPVRLAYHYQEAELYSDAQAALCIASTAALHGGDLDSALDFIEQAERCGDKIEDSATRKELLRIKIRALELDGRHNEALMAIAQLSSLSTNQTDKIHGIYNSGRLEVVLGNSSEALRASRQAAETFSKDIPNGAYGWVELAVGDALLARGDTITACSAFQDCYSRARKTENRSLATESIVRLARVAYSTSDFPQAIQLFEKARARYIRDLENPRGEAKTLLGLGASYVMLGDLKQAVNNLDEARGLFEALPDKSNLLMLRMYELFLEDEKLEEGTSPELIQTEINRAKTLDCRESFLFGGILLIRNHLRFKRREEALEVAQAMFSDAIRSLPRFVVSIESELGLALVETGNLDQGLKHTEAAVARLESQKAIEDDDPHRIYLNYAKALKHCNQAAQSTRVLQQAFKTMSDIESKLNPTSKRLFRRRPLNLEIAEQLSAEK